jgi:hypothetical protein
MELVGHANVLDWRGFERSLRLTENGGADDYLIAFPGCLSAALPTKSSRNVIQSCLRSAHPAETKPDQAAACLLPSPRKPMNRKDIKIIAHAQMPFAKPNNLTGRASHQSLSE